MQIDKDMIVEFIKDRLGQDKADAAEQELPGTVDTERDAGLLSKFGIDIGDLVKMATSGGLGNITGGLGKLLGK